MSNVFFMGAGFSKAVAGYPILNELSLIVKKHYMSKQSDSLDEIKTHIKNLPFYMNSSFEVYSESDNIESILTYLLQNLPYKNSVLKSLDLACYHDISQFIGNYFCGLETDVTLNTCSNILKYIIDNRVPCITLNYDTLLETLLKKYCSEHAEYDLIDNKEFYPYLSKNNGQSLGYISTGLILDCGTTRNYMSPDKVPQIIKMHGSINWALNNSNQIILKNKENGLPYIIPPVLDKSQIYTNDISDIWISGYNKIKKAKNIYIFGFSFPTTDISIKYLFQSALKENNNNPNVYAINIDSENLRKQYDNIFAGFSNIKYDYCVNNPLEKFNNDILHIN